MSVIRHYLFNYVQLYSTLVNLFEGSNMVYFNFCTVASIFSRLHLEAKLEDLIAGFIQNVNNNKCYVVE